MLSNTDSLLSFWIGSSVVSGLVSFGYIGAGMSQWRTKEWNAQQDFNNFEWMMAMVLILLGLFNVVGQNLVSIWGYWINFLIGALFGLLLSSIGRFGYDFPIKVFGFSEQNDYMVHVHAAILYSIIFGTIIGLPSWWFIQKNNI